MNEAILRINGAAELILPEIILVVTACAHFFAGPFLVTPSGEAPQGLRHRWGAFALIGLLLAVGTWLGYQPTALSGPQLGPFQVDEMTGLIRGFSFAAGFILLLLNWNQVEDNHAAEYHACLLLILAGINLTAAANDLVGLFLALELVSIPTYVTLYLGKHDAEGQEAAIKYFLISIFSSAVLLFGFTYLYGVTGTTNLTSIHGAMVAGGGQPIPGLLRIAVLAVVAGLAFRITAVPFHFYAPDVFQGTAGTGSALLAIVPKIAGFAAMIRLLITPDAVLDVLQPAAEPRWTLATEAAPVLWLLSAASVLVGNMVALQQTDLRRLLAWSSIAHAGYMLIGFTVATSSGQSGLNALLFYLAAYAAMTVGAFAVLIQLSRRHRPLAGIDDLSGLAQAHPLPALAMTAFLLSLIGLPPTAGFLGKLNLLLTAWSSQSPIHHLPDGRWLAGVLVLGAAIGAWYYLRLIGRMYFGEARPETWRDPKPRDIPAAIGVSCCVAVTVALFVTPNLLWNLIARMP